MKIIKVESSRYYKFSQQPDKYNCEKYSIKTRRKEANRVSSAFYVL